MTDQAPVLCGCFTTIQFLVGAALSAALANFLQLSEKENHTKILAEIFLTKDFVGKGNTCFSLYNLKLSSYIPKKSCQDLCFEN